MKHIVHLPIQVIWEIQAIPNPIMEDENNMLNELDRILNRHRVPLDAWELWEAYMDWVTLPKKTIH